MFRTPSLFNRNRNAPALSGRDAQDPFYQFHQEMNRLFEDFFSGFGAPTYFSGDRSNARAIHVDVQEKKNTVELEAELPGVDEDDINVELSENVLTISGERKFEEEDSHGGSRRAYSSFQRTLSLPFEVDPDAVEAKFKNGVLKLSLPKPQELEARTRKIEVKRG